MFADWSRDSNVNPASTHRPKWEIDRLLDSLIGQEVRVAANSFSPAPANGEHPQRFVPVRELFLPDNTRPSSLPVYFEGTLEKHWRRIGVVYAYLDGPKMPDGAAEGTTPFRGRIAVILKGPALVQLAFPFEVEKLPADPDNYWRDLKVPCAQFEFAFSEATGIGDHRDSPSREAVV